MILIKLISIHDQVTCLVDVGKAMDIIYLGFSKAFDTIFRSTLLKKLGQVHPLLDKNCLDGWAQSCSEWFCIQLMSWHQWYPPGICVGASSV